MLHNIGYLADNKKIMKTNTPNITSQLWMLHNRFISNIEVQNFIMISLTSNNLKELFITSNQDRPSLIALIDNYILESKETIIFELLDYLKENNIDYNEDIECLIYCKNTIIGFDKYYKKNEKYFIDCIECYVDSVAQEIDEYNDGIDTIHILSEFNETFSCNINYNYLDQLTDRIERNRVDYDLWKESSMEQKFDIKMENRIIDSMFETLSNK